MSLCISAAGQAAKMQSDKGWKQCQEPYVTQTGNLVALRMVSHDVEGRRRWAGSVANMNARNKCREQQVVQP